MVTFENMVLDQDDNNEKCRNGLKIREHPLKFRNSFTDDIKDFDEEIKHLETQTGNFHK